MRRFSRLALMVLWLLPLLASALSAWLWRHSYIGRRDQISLRLHGERIVLRSSAGRVTAWKLPVAGGADHDRLKAWVARTRNADLTWDAFVFAVDRFHPPSGNSVGPLISIRSLDNRLEPRALPQYFAWSVVRFPDASLSPLVNALDDPDRFAAAHAMLACVTDLNRWPLTRGGGVYRDEGRRQITADFDNLRFELPPDTGWNADPFFAALYEGPAAGYSPAQIPLLRDLWFDRLALPAGSCPWWLIASSLALPAGIALALRLRRPAIVLRD